MWGSGSVNISCLSRKHIRVLFFVVLLYFAGGFIATATVGEPYPAIMMPGFGLPERATQRTETARDDHGGSKGAEIRYAPSHLVVHFDDGERNLAIEELLHGIADSHHPAIMFRNFSPPEAWLTTPRQKSDPPRWRRVLEETVFPGLRTRRSKPYLMDPSRDELVRWLRGRIRAVFPGTDPREAVVIWRSVTELGDHGEARATLRINLSEPSP